MPGATLPIIPANGPRPLGPVLPTNFGSVTPNSPSLIWASQYVFKSSKLGSTVIGDPITMPGFDSFVETFWPSSKPSIICNTALSSTLSGKYVFNICAVCGSLILW